MVLLAIPLAGLIGLLIYLVIAGVVTGLLFWCVNRLSAAFGIPEPIKTVIIVVLVILVVLSLLYFIIGNLPVR